MRRRLKSNRRLGRDADELERHRESIHPAPTPGAEVQPTDTNGRLGPTRVSVHEVLRVVRLWMLRTEPRFACRACLELGQHAPCQLTNLLPLGRNAESIVRPQF